MDRRANLRASDADRELIVDRLHRAATEGRILAEELEHRVTSALKARTYGELEATVSDLPGPRRRHPGPMRPARSAAGWAVSTTRANPMLLIFMIPVAAVTLAMVVAAMTMWAVLVTVAMILGHRSGHPSPLTYRRHQRLHPARRGPNSSWI